MTIFGKGGYSTSQANALRLFAPNNIRKVDGDSLKNYDIGSTSSFKIKPEGSGLKSTQQLNIDWSDFSQHTFFNSAQVKTNVAFDRILNDFPFNGSIKDINIFLEQITGFEKYVYDNFPKYKGYMFFSGTNVNETLGGTYVTVKDIAGAAYPDMSTNRSGQTGLNPGYNSMTIEMQLYIPTIANTEQYIIDKHEGTSATNSHGYCLTLSGSNNTNYCTASFYILSGTQIETIKTPLIKGQWNHLAYVWDRTPGINKIFSYVNQNLVSQTTALKEFDFLTNTTTDMIIGSGSAVLGLINPLTTFSGAIDELRIWNTPKSKEELTAYAQKNVFNDSNLQLYYRFNEPQNIQSLAVIDYSKNSLHGKLSLFGYQLGVRDIPTSSIAGPSPMTYERLYHNPILFPDYEDIVSMRDTLLSSSAVFDEFNPNIITRLIPKHYLLDGLVKDGLNNENGLLIENLQTGIDPRTSVLGGTQTMLLLMYTWAKYFDELKLYIQEFSNLNWVDYNQTNNIPNEFLQNIANQYGIELPYLFQDASLEQYFDGENIDGNISNNNETLQSVQNQIWRRILINLQDVLKSKGTIHSVKSYLRSIGIDPDNNFRIREYGGPTKRNLSWVRDKRSDIATFINFVSGGLLQTNDLFETSYVSNPYLKSTSPGWPESSEAASTDFFIEGGRLLTSGSWTYEGLYKYNTNSSHLTQSFAQFFGESAASLSAEALIGNLIYNKSENKVQFLYLPNLTVGGLSPTNTTPITLTVTGVNMSDGDPWYISVGKERADDPQFDTTNLLSKYFLRVAKNMNGEIVEAYTNVSWSTIVANTDLDEKLQVGPTVMTDFRRYITIGSQSIPNSFALSNNTYDNYYRASNFDGQVSQMRFWSKYLNDKEWTEHVRNYHSVGVNDPKTNWNFDYYATGSWNRLRMEIQVDQINETTDTNGSFTLTDFAQNNLWMTASNFPLTSSNVFTNYQLYYSYLSPRFDEGSTVEKVRIRSYEDYNNLTQTDSWAEVAPVYEIPPSEKPFDSTKFTIDFSIMDSLNQDIMSIMSTLDVMDNALGSPELLYAPHYVDLEVLRKNYFNKLTDKINIKGFFEFYKWFDTNIGVFIAQLLPAKTKFVGTNYIVENNVLTRPKIQYHSDDIYLGDTNRNGLKATILIQLISSHMNRY